MAAIVLAAAAFTSCDVSDDINDTNEAVRFTAGIDHATTPQGAPGSRAAGTTWGNDAIGIFMVENGTKTIAENAENKKYTTAGTGTFTAATAGDAMYYPMIDNTVVGFIAYYPYENGATLTTPIDITIGDQTNQPSFDLLYSSGATGSKATASTPVALTFTHKLAKIVMNCTADANVSTTLTGMTVTIKGMNTENKFDLSDGTLGNTPNTPLAIAPRTVTDGSKYDAIIMPGSYAAGDVTVDFKVGTEIFTWTLTAADAVFEGGNEYTYAVTLTRTGVNVTGTISPWITGGSNDRGPVEAE